MNLYDIPSQQREKAIIWHILGNLPLYTNLLRYAPWKWFAINIPSDLDTGGANTTDIDILACLLHPPRMELRFYRAWEVKVGLLFADGTGKSLKGGKTDKIAHQLKACLDYGIPEVNLLDVYLCDYDFMRMGRFPPHVIVDINMQRAVAARAIGCGYEVLPFGVRDPHNLDSLSVFAPGGPGRSLMQTSFPLIGGVVRPARQPFTLLAEHLNAFHDAHGGLSGEGGPAQIVYCRACRRLGLLRVKTSHHCPNCRDDLLQQT